MGLETVDHKFYAIHHSTCFYILIANESMASQICFIYISSSSVLVGNSPCHTHRVSFSPGQSTFHRWSQIHLQKWLIFPIITDYFHWSILSLVHTTNTFKCQCGDKLSLIISFQRSWFFFFLLIFWDIYISLWPDLSLKLSGIICIKPHKHKILLKYFTCKDFLQNM